MANLPNLPDISTARLPATYEAAKSALAECSRIDECQKWADKAEALASYAKQARDDQMRKMADRIQARAIRRCGELLKQIQPQQGGDRKSNGRHRPFDRKQAARGAGLSERQQKTAIRVANVPQSDFEEAVESESPPTVTELADRGKKLVEIGDSKPANFAAATRALSQLRRFAEFASEHDPAEVANGVRPSEYGDARKYVRVIDAWLDQFITRIGD
jgi:hypothetical protein